MKKILAISIAVLSVVLIGGSVAQSVRTRLDLRTGPTINSGDVSNLALVLSVEFPTVRTAYQGSAYSSTKKYLGYFDSNSCYQYNGTAADGYFQPSGRTDANYFCNQGAATGSGFSGNFMNFAATSSIDILRLALTGGDRVVDESAATSGTPSDPRTILQRAILPVGGSNTDFYASGNFPARTLPAGTLTAAVTPFGSALAVTVRSCSNYIAFGRTSSSNGSCASPTADAPLTNTAGVAVVGATRARVLVCNTTEGPIRSDLCKQNPDGFYKPVGEVQKNADKVRVAAFGYLIDQVNTRYGGVLRAPMKFAGPNQKSAAGIVSLNPEKEWDDTTGVFVLKPINTANEAGYTTTGVVNYLNQFGRLTNSTDFYKRFDPVGELYYEAIRYFQGQQPTASAFSGTTTTNLAGYPIYTTWTDPMQTSCQRNYALLIADNNTHLDGQIPGSTINSGGADQRRAAVSVTSGSVTVTLDADYWTTRLTSFETNGNLTYPDSQGVTRVANGNATTGVTGVVAANTNLDTKATGADRASYLYAGVAYWANTHAIRPDKPQARVRTFVIDVDENGNGDINNTRTRALYLAGKYGGFADTGPDGSHATGEGNPFQTYVNGTLTTSQNEWLAPDTSTSPSGYFLSSQPERMILAIRKIFAEASRPSGNLAGGSLSVSRLSQAQQTGAFYQAQLDSTDWSGTVIRTEITFNTTTQALEANPTPIWDAANILTGIQPGTTTLSPFILPANRKIFSYSSTALAGVPFTWDDIDPAVQASLQANPVSSIPETTSVGQARLDYIRGDRTGESDPDLNFRGRRRIMGDSINSAPFLKGKPSADIVDASYAAFRTTYASRTPTVYIGSNDGMLHAFHAAESVTDPSNGREVFAYVPRAISTKLNKLTDPGYIKEPYVDASLTVGEARAHKTSGPVDWATVLVSGMGGGAKGLFALDVTSPTTFQASNVLWEFTEADDPDMGHLLSEPKIVKLAMNGNGAATPNYQWFAMVTSGYNNYTTGGAGDKQALFLLSLEKAPGTAWSQGVNFFKIIADNSSFTASNNAATGLGMPGVATGIAGNALFAYAGDLQGNLWKFDLTGASTTWTGSSAATVLFIARNAAGTATQPITVIPAVTLNVAGGYQIGFGTGKFIEPLDGLLTSAAQQSLYGIWDSGDDVRFERRPTGSGSPPSINGLITRTLTVTAGSTTTSLTGPGFFYGKSSATGSGQYRGWVADLSTTMERVAVDPAVDNGLMAVNSTIPGGDPCSGTGGANQFRYNPSTGLSFVTTGTGTSTGFLGSPSLLEVGDTVWSFRNSSGRYLVTRKISSISPGVGGGLSTQSSTVTSIAGRISWREITNFQ